MEESGGALRHSSSSGAEQVACRRAGVEAETAARRAECRNGHETGRPDSGQALAAQAVKPKGAPPTGFPDRAVAETRLGEGPEHGQRRCSKKLTLARGNSGRRQVQFGAFCTSPPKLASSRFAKFGAQSDRSRDHEALKRCTGRPLRVKGILGAHANDGRARRQCAGWAADVVNVLAFPDFARSRSRGRLGRAKGAVASTSGTARRIQRRQPRAWTLGDTQEYNPHAASRSRRPLRLGQV